MYKGKDREAGPEGFLKLYGPYDSSTDGVIIRRDMLCYISYSSIIC